MTLKQKLRVTPPKIKGHIKGRALVHTFLQAHLIKGHIKGHIRGPNRACIGVMMCSLLASARSSEALGAMAPLGLQGMVKYMQGHCLCGSCLCGARGVCVLLLLPIVVGVLFNVMALW